MRLLIHGVTELNFRHAVLASVLQPAFNLQRLRGQLRQITTPGE